MYFKGGTKLNLNWITPLLIIFSIVGCLTVKALFEISWARSIVLCLNMLGTVLLASAFEAAIPLHGDGGWRDSLRFAIKELPKYGSPPAFNIAKFYSGLLLLLIGMLAASVVS